MSLFPSFSKVNIEGGTHRKTIHRDCSIDLSLQFPLLKFQVLLQFYQLLTLILF